MRRPEMSFLLGVIVAALLVEAAGAATCAAANATYPLCSDSACAGSCNPGSGCLCSDGSTTCLPVTCSSALFPNPPPGCCPPGLFWHPDIQCCSEELNCAPACNADEICTNDNGYGACTCNATYYQHLNRSDITPTVTCLPQPGTPYQVAHIPFPKCMLEILHYDYTGMHPLHSSEDCVGLAYDDGAGHIVFDGLTLTGWCGNIMNVTSNTVIFSNFLYLPADNSSGIIFTNPLNFSYSCDYNLTMQTSLNITLHPLLTTVDVPLGNGVGSVAVTMAAYHSNAYTDPLTTDTTLDVGTPIYIGIMADSADGSKFALRAVRCVASPINSATYPNAVVLIDGGCAVNQDVNTQVVSNGQSLEVKFSFDTFAFQNQPPDLYLFCDVRMCVTANETCSACSAPGTRAAQADSTIGPLNVQLQYTNAGSHAAVSWAVLGSSLLALLTLRLM